MTSAALLVAVSVPAVPPTTSAQLSILSAQDDLNNRATTFVHLHIQKTAGSALQCVMEEHPLSPCTIERAAWASDIESRQPQGAYASGFWNTTAAVAHTANAVKHNFPNAWCKGGEIGGTHASLSTLRLAAEAAGKLKVRFVTMLREPVARVISEWINNADDALKDRNCAALTGNAWRPYVGDWEYRCGGWRVDANCSFASFLNSSAAEVGWSNRQTRMLVAPGVRLEGTVTAATRARAVEVMHSLDFVGIVERFADSMLLLSYVFRASLPHMTSFTVGTPNIAKTKYEPTPSERAFLERANEHDTALHDAATARFDADWAAMLADETFVARGMRFYSPDQVNYTLIPASDVPPPSPPAPPAAEQSSEPPRPDHDELDQMLEFCPSRAATRSFGCDEDL